MSTSAVPELLTAALASRYTLERELGRGGMATVWLAEDRKHHRRVALKVLHPELAATVGPERFLREIATLAGLTHPHILPLHDSGDAAGLLYYVMPFVPGESLRDRLRREVQLPIEAAVRIAEQVGLALDYAHRHGIVHRDIKPENILLEDGQAVVADFGIAQAVSEAGGARLTGSGLTVGTPAYMSPEQATGGPVDPRSDQYALGCVLYEMLAGEPPFSGPTVQAILAKRLHESPPRLRIVREAVPSTLERAVTKALARVPADRYPSTAEFGAAITAAVAVPEAARGLARAVRMPGRSRAALAAVVAAIAIGGFALADRRPSPRVTAAVPALTPPPTPRLDATLVAVAPFEVLGGDSVWREGLVDVLSRTLDGLATLRTVSPTVVLRRWRGRPDAPSARELGRRTGAGLVVYGQLVGIGRDSVRLSATVLDVASGEVRTEFERAESATRIAALTDSVSLGVLRGLDRGSRRGDPVRLVSVGTRSLPALRAFLQGEQLLRRAQFDSAVEAYDRAVALDGRFAFAVRRAGFARGWEGVSPDRADTIHYQLRAGRLNHGLAPRDSLLIVADSIYEATWSAPTERQSLPLARRGVAVLLEGTRRYPDDPEMWYQLGEHYRHFGWQLGITPLQTLEAFDRAIALDSTFAPAYIHPLELAPHEQDVARALRYARAYAVAAPGREDAPKRLVALRLLATAAPDSTLRHLADTGSADLVKGVLWFGGAFADSAETMLRLARLWFEALSRPGRQADDSLERRNDLAFYLAMHGRMREAAAVIGHRAAIAMPGIVLEAALAGAVPPDSAAARFATYREAEDVRLAAVGLAWWMAHGNSAAILGMKWRADSLARAGADADARDAGRDVSRSSEVALALARRDTAAALRRLAAFPGHFEPNDHWRGVLKGRLLAAQGRDREAATLLAWNLDPWPSHTFGWLAQARVAERLGDRATAVKAYRYVADIWREADPELQPYATEARQALARLGTAPAR